MRILGLIISEFFDEKQKRSLNDKQLKILIPIDFNATVYKPEFD